MKIICRNCNDKTQAKHAEAMMEAGFSIWHIECQNCGEKALAKDERAEFAAQGGATKSKAKTKTARANGAKGGRPNAKIIAAAKAHI